jgi:hypothetical protein
MVHENSNPEYLDQSLCENLLKLDPASAAAEAVKKIEEATPAQSENP